MDKIPADLLQFARSLRQQQTDAERLLWRLLRNRRLDGCKFRRQYPLGRYILDFYCSSKRLAIELDGGGHTEEPQANHDAERTVYLQGQGIRVLRFWDADVLLRLEAVLGEIWNQLHA